MVNGRPVMIRNNPLTVSPFSPRHLETAAQREVMPPVGIQRTLVQIEILLGKHLEVVIRQGRAVVVPAGVAQRVARAGSPEAAEPSFPLKVEAVVSGFAGVIESKIDAALKRRDAPAGWPVPSDPSD